MRMFLWSIGLWVVSKVWRRIEDSRYPSADKPKPRIHLLHCIPHTCARATITILFTFPLCNRIYCFRLQVWLILNASRIEAIFNIACAACLYGKELHIVCMYVRVCDVFPLYLSTLCKPKTLKIDSNDPHFFAIAAFPFHMCCLCFGGSRPSSSLSLSLSLVGLSDSQSYNSYLRTYKSKRKAQEVDWYSQMTYKSMGITMQYIGFEWHNIRGSIFNLYANQSIHPIRARASTATAPTHTHKWNRRTNINR